MKILIAGDFVPQNRVATLFSKGKFEQVLCQVKNFTANVDYSIVNLEAPIVVSKECSPIEKSGPCLKTDLKAIDALKYVGFNAVTLANNHTRDYGDWGISDTLFQLSKSDLDTVGAGLDQQDANTTLYKTIDCTKKNEVVAFVNCCEHEFSIAGIAKAGANSINPIKQYYAIREAKAKSDHLIVIVHGGIEHYNLPTPRMQELYRFFIDCGADAVVNHHQHCYSGYEIYNNKPIFYGLGNFCFDWELNNSKLWTEGYMVLLDISDKVRFELIPYKQGGTSPAIEIMKGSDKLSFYSSIEHLNAVIADYQQLEDKYNHFLNQTDRLYKNVISPYSNRIFCALYIRNLVPSFISKKKWHSIYNKIQCESHRERLIHMIKKYHI